MRAAATCRSGLYVSASWTRASRPGSLKAASQPFTTASGTPPRSLHCAGTVRLGSAWPRTSSGLGGALSAQPAIAAARTAVSKARYTRVISVQLQDKVVDVRAHAQNHLADDVDLMEALGIDRRVARRARCHEQILVLVRDVELDREAPGWLRQHPDHRERSAGRQL